MTAPNPPLDTVILSNEAQTLLRRIEGRALDDILSSEALRVIRAIWPKAFNVVKPKPLKIHIHKDMEEADVVSSELIKKALRFFTSQDRYLATLKPGSVRFDLQGMHSGKVRLREAVDAEIKRYHLNHPPVEQRERVIIKKIRLVSVKKAS